MLHKIVEKWGGSLVTPEVFYTDIFKLGDGLIQSSGDSHDMRANPIIIGGIGSKVKRHIMLEDTFFETLEEFSSYDWAYMSGCTYFGKKNSADHQSKLFAMIFDIDGVEEENLTNFFSGAFRAKAYPIPQYVVLSGHGIHLYYVFEEPVSLYPNLKPKIKELKYQLTRLLWNGYTSTIKKQQYQGINQSFRVPGSKTKPDCDLKICTAYRISEHPTTILELNNSLPEWYRVDFSDNHMDTLFTLEEAKEKFPGWYERVVVNKQPKKTWTVKEDLYNWWLRQIESGASYGHRYFCIMALAIFAVKCGIYDYDRVYKDACNLLPHFNEIRPDAPFTKADIKSALDCLDGRFMTFPREDIEKLTAITMPANKRNGRKQAVHLAGARAVQEINDKFNGTNWREGNGRKPKRELVQNYAAEHPGMSQRAIAKELGISKTTVNKWLKNL